MRGGCKRAYCKYKGENNQSHLKVSRLNWAMGGGGGVVGRELGKREPREKWGRDEQVG